MAVERSFKILFCLATALVAVDDEGVLVAAFVAAEAEIRQDYFLLCARAVFAGRALAAERAAVFRRGTGAAFRAAPGRLAAGRACAARLATLGVAVLGPAAGARCVSELVRLTSGAVRCIRVNRV